MITDQELTTELTRALHGGTDHLTYTGTVPRARRPIATTVAPVAATAAVATVLGWSAITSGGPATEAPGDVRTADVVRGPTSSPTDEPRVVTEQIELAGMTFTYTRGADEPPLATECPDGYEPVGDPRTVPCSVAVTATRTEVPDGATRHDIDGMTVWIATDPETGWSGFYLEDHGWVYAVLSQTRTLDQMEELAASLSLA